MTMHIKVGGTWREVTPSVSVGGVWQSITEGWIKVAGVWQQFFDAIVPPTLTATLTPADDGFGVVGYNAPGVIGSMTPTVTSDGRTVQAWYDASGSIAVVNVSGFSAPITQTNWATSFTANGVTLLTADATNFSYSFGAALWEWNGSTFGFVDAVPVAASIP